MKRIRNWYRLRRHGIRITKVGHFALDGVDIQFTRFKAAERDELPSRPACGPFELEPVLPN